MNAKGTRIWHTIRVPGESCMIERGDLCEILKSGAGPIRYDSGVISVVQDSDGVSLIMSDGSTERADLVIGTDGMFSKIRKALYPVDGYEITKWTTINLRASSVERFLRDKHGMNVIYGRGWSAALTPLPDSVYVAITVQAPVIDSRKALEALPRCPFVDTLLSDPGMEDAGSFPLYTAKTTMVGSGNIVLVGDASHGMVPFCGAGASAAMKDAYELSKVIAGWTEGASSSAARKRDLDSYNRELRKRNNPLIKASSRLLSLAQGRTIVGRATRGIAFRTIDVIDSVAPTRRRLERELCTKLAEEESKAASVSDASERGLAMVT
jgi:salicylate hydroxylase